MGKSQRRHNPISPANTAEATEKPTQCTVKIKGISQDTSVQEQGPAQVTPDAEEKAQHIDLHFRDIEQNIESIESGLEQVRLGRIEEARAVQTPDQRDGGDGSN